MKQCLGANLPALLLAALAPWGFGAAPAAGAAGPGEAYAIGPTPRPGDWPRWGGRNWVNLVSAERDLPDAVAPGEWRAAADPPQGGRLVHDPAKAVNLKWAAPLGLPMGKGVCYGAPVVAQGKVLVGCDGSAVDPRYVYPEDYFTTLRFSAKNNRMKRGALLCLDAATGGLVWQYNVNGHPKYSKVPESQYRVGVANSPVVEGDRVYVVGYEDEVMCLDLKGQADGNQGPFLDEREHFRNHWPPEGQDGRLDRLEPSDADVLWMYHIPRELGLTFDCAAASSPLVYNDRIYVGTCLGIAHKGPNNHRKCETPDAPALIVLDKHTGRLLAAENEGIAARVEHGSWSGPSLVMAGGRPLILFGGGDEFCYAFDPEPAPGRERTYAAEDPADGTITIPASVGILRCVWTFNANGDNATPYAFHKASREMAGAVIGTPVCAADRVFVNVGVDWSKPSKGILSCYDATGSGDVSRSGRVWLCEAVGPSCSTPAAAGGLVFTGDYGGNLHCVDAATGRPLWTQKLRGAIHASPLVADGKVYIGSSFGDFAILKAQREKSVLCETSFSGRSCRNGIEASAVAANGVLYVPTHTVLYAFEKK